ncbi:histidine phosphatase family protein [Mesorhizobium tianshanense]|uniref:Broad specificity phosphatase PhoE n=1 Tax=Mesorhizobium tianshanense TaxID=39844 RepID=A0A562PD93_9HYPH|nr:histidine phosphatase family protein [Mesorhizobium tianshanense]TWI41946.1 broad specificity phosphatase PhoE [Mesorhizobium tianshanense]
MPTAFFITHPEVTVDPAQPVPAWRLSDRGVARMRTFAGSAVLSGLTSIWSSSEAKAIEAAGLLAAGFGVPVQVDEHLGENDRSATGFLPPVDFERVADAFFANPHESVRGWERAVDAQERVVGAVFRILGSHRAGDLAFIAHGGVGTLLLCKLLDAPISRSRDQPSQGHFFAFDLQSCQIIHEWRSIDED